MGCFNPYLGQIWTNPNVGLKKLIKISNQLQLSLSTVKFLITFLNQHLGLSQIWVETTQHFLESNNLKNLSPLLNVLWNGMFPWMFFKVLQGTIKKLCFQECMT